MAYEAAVHMVFANGLHFEHCNLSVSHSWAPSISEHTEVLHVWSLQFW